MAIFTAAAIAGLPLLAKLILGTAATGAAVGGIRAATGSSEKRREEDEDQEVETPNNAFMGALDWMGQTSQPVLNMFAGDFGAVGRQTADLVGRLANTAIPFGDPLPRFVDKADFKSASELVGAEDLPGYAKLPIDMAGDILTSPLSAVSFGGGGAAAKAAKGLATAGRLGEGAGLQAAKSAAKIAGKEFLPAVGKKAAKTYASQATQEALPAIIESGISGAGRRAIAKAGGEPALKELIEGVTRTLGDDLSEKNIRAVMRRPEFRNIFDQGGIQFAGQQVVTPEVIGKVASKVSSLVPPSVAKGAASAGNIAKRALGWDFSDDATKALKYSSLSAGSNAARRSIERAANIMTGASKAEDNVIAQVLDNLAWSGNKPIALLDDATDIAFKSADDVKAALRQRIERLKEAGANLTDQDLAKVDFDKITQKLDDIVDASGDDWAELIQEGAISPTSSDLGRGSYLRRMMKGDQLDEFDNVAAELTGNPSSLKGRSLKTDADLLKFLQEQPNVSFERSATKRLLERSGQQGSIVGRAKAAQKILMDPDAILGESKGAVQEIIKNLGSKDKNLALWVQDLTQGMPARNASKLISKANRIFKPAAVYGIGVPRFGSIVRNELGGIWQAASAIGPDAALLQAKRLPQQLWDSVAAGAKKAFNLDLPVSDVTRRLQMVDDVYARAAAGELKGMPAIKAALRKSDPILADAMEDGVLDAFVSSEQLLSQVARNPTMQKITNVMDMPGAMFQQVESGLRMAQYLALRKAGVGRIKAAQHVRDAFLDYSVANVANRRMRDIIPFIQFTSQSLPQQAKFLSRAPAVGVALSNLYGQSDVALPPHMEGRAAIDLGTDNEGNPVVASGAGLPVETLGLIPSIPNLFDIGSIRQSGREIRTGLVSQTQPIIKTGLSAIMGRDPYFDTPFGSYDVAPQFAQALGAEKHSELARLYNTAAGTGLPQPVTSPIGELNKIFDSRKTPAQRLLNTLTGLRVMSVDEDRAIQAKLEEVLSDNPSIRQGRFMYSTTNDPKTERLLELHAEAKARIKARKLGDQ